MRRQNTSTRTVVEAVNGLTSRWAATFAPDRGTVFSAPGVWPLLTFLADGAGGAARAELADAVGLRADEAAGAARELLARVADMRGVDAAVGLWTKRTLTLRDAWRDGVPVEALGVLTGDLEADAAALDAWASQRTGGQIERMPVRLTRDTALVLASALTLRTDWEVPFDGRFTRPDTGPWKGRALAGLQRSIPGLDAVRVGSSAAGLVTEATVRGTAGTDVLLLLGEARMPPGEVLAAGVGMLAGDVPATPGAELAHSAAGPGLALRTTRTDEPGPPHIRLNTVEFTLDAEHDLLASPGIFGLEAAAAPLPGAFPGISDFPLAVRSARQSATATFGTAGFRAATVTAVGIDWMGQPTNETTELGVTVDRPFGFLAVHRTSRLVLAAGWVTDPEQYREDEDVQE